MAYTKVYKTLVYKKLCKQLALHQFMYRRSETNPTIPNALYAQSIIALFK